jgi:catechol 2,3-dioxygenase-like lactoylglutathione lyase family enzyme
MKRLALMISVCLLSFLAIPAFAADAPQPRPADAPVLAHIHIYCNQLDPMIEFFVKGFDAQLIMRRKFGSDDGAVISMGAAPLYIQQSKVDAAKSGIVAYDHIGLNVGDIEAALKKAMSAPGAKLDKDIHAVGVGGTAKAAFVRGPEGIRVEMVQPPPKK